MKPRKPLTSKTGLKSGKSPGLARRNANLRRNTPKRAKVNRAASKLHAAWLATYKHCWECGSTHGLHVHHISKRSRGGDWDHPANWYVACPTCNCGPLDKSDRATMARALARKRINDPENFDLDKWREIHGPSPERPTSDDVWWAEGGLVLKGDLQPGTRQRRN